VIRVLYGVIVKLNSSTALSKYFNLLVYI